MRWTMGHFLLAAVLAAPLVRAQDGGDAKERQEIEQARNDPNVAHLPISDVLQISLDGFNNNLILSTRLHSTSGWTVIVADPLEGICRVQLRGLGVWNGGPQPFFRPPYTPDTFMFIHTNTLPGGEEEAITVSLNPMKLSISQDSDSPTETRNISLMQNAPGFLNGEPPVHLIVNVTSKMNGVAPKKVDRTADDFLSLRRMYRGDTAIYLEPIFRELHIEEAIFGSDPVLAWEVFADEARPAAGAMSSVRQIVVELDSDDFHVRQTAARKLQDMGEPAAICLMHIDRSSLSAEQNSRIDAFLSAYHPVADEDVVRLRSDVNFLLDCLFETDDFIVHSALDRLEKVTGRTIAFDTSLRGEARRTAVGSLRELLASPTTQP